MFQSTRQGAVRIVSGTNPLNAENVSLAQAAFQECLEGGQPRVVMNLQSIPLIDSAGLELLLDMRDRCAERGGVMQLASPSPLCRDILKITDVASQFAIFDDVNAAVGSFSQ